MQGGPVPRGILAGWEGALAGPSRCPFLPSDLQGAAKTMLTHPGAAPSFPPSFLSSFPPPSLRSAEVSDSSRRWKLRHKPKRCARGQGQGRDCRHALQTWTWKPGFPTVFLARGPSGELYFFGFCPRVFPFSLVCGFYFILFFLNDYFGAIIHRSYKSPI